MISASSLIISYITYKRTTEINIQISGLKEKIVTDAQFIDRKSSLTSRLDKDIKNFENAKSLDEIKNLIPYFRSTGNMILSFKKCFDKEDASKISEAFNFFDKLSKNEEGLTTSNKNVCFNHLLDMKNILDNKWRSML